MLSITSGTSGSLAVASLRTGLPQPAGVTDTRHWTGLEAAGITGALTVPGIAASVSQLAVRVNRATGARTTPTSTKAATALSWASRVPVAGLTLSGTTTLISGLASLSIADLLDGTARFSISHQDVVVQAPVSSGSPVSEAAGMTRLSLSELGLSIGTSEFGVSLDPSGTLDVVVVKTTGLTPVTWTGVVANDIGATVNLGGLASLSVPSVDVSVSRVTGGTLKLNFATALDLDGPLAGPFESDPIVLADGTTFAPGSADVVSATGATFSLADGLISGGADFALVRQTLKVKPDSAAAVDATLMRIDLSNLALDAGGDAFGLVLSGSGGLTIAAVATTATPGQRWLGVVASGISASVRLGPVASLDATSLNVELNQASAGAPDLDFATELDLDSDGTLLETEDKLMRNSAVFDPDAFVVGATNVSVSILDGLVSGSASFAIARSLVDLDLDGASTTAAGSKTPSMLTVALSNLTLSLGAPGSGLAITGGTIAVAAIRAPVGATESRRWTAVDGEEPDVTIDLGPAVNVSVTGATIDVNTMSGTSGTAPGTPRRA